MGELTGSASGSRRLEGRVAVVTGAAWGMGRRHAERLAAEGAQVVLADIQHDLVKETAGRIAGSIAVRCDVSSAADVERMVDEATKAFGRIDVLVNNAGGALIPPGRMFWELEESDWDRVVDVNLKGIWLCTKAVLPSMRKQGAGRVVNIASTAGLRATPTMAAYSAAKGGVVAVTKTMAAELGKFRITVNAIAPGFIDAKHPKLSIPPELHERLVARAMQSQFIPRIGEMDDISNAVLFFAAAESDWVTGQVLTVNGGEAAS